MKRIGLFVIVFFCISLLLHASGPRVLFIGDSITDGNWGNACGMPKPTAEPAEASMTPNLLPKLALSLFVIKRRFFFQFVINTS